jgi:hypothetical protein
MAPRRGLARSLPPGRRLHVKASHAPHMGQRYRGGRDEPASVAGGGGHGRNWPVLGGARRRSRARRRPRAAGGGQRRGNRTATEPNPTARVSRGVALGQERRGTRRDPVEWAKPHLPQTVVVAFVAGVGPDGGKRRRRVGEPSGGGGSGNQAAGRGGSAGEEIEENERVESGRVGLT